MIASVDECESIKFEHGPLFALEDLEVHQHRNCFFPYAAYHYGSDTLFFTAKKGLRGLHLQTVLVDETVNAAEHEAGNDPPSSKNKGRPLVHNIPASSTRSYTDISVKDLTLSCVVFNQAQTRVALVTRLDPTPAVTPSNLPLFLVAAVEAENGTFKNYLPFPCLAKNSKRTKACGSADNVAASVRELNWTLSDEIAFCDTRGDVWIVSECVRSDEEGETTPLIVRCVDFPDDVVIFHIATSMPDVPFVKTLQRSHGFLGQMDPSSSSSSVNIVLAAGPTIDFLYGVVPSCSKPENGDSIEAYKVDTLLVRDALLGVISDNDASPKSTRFTVHSLNPVGASGLDWMLGVVRTADEEEQPDVLHVFFTLSADGRSISAVKGIMLNEVQVTLPAFEPFDLAQMPQQCPLTLPSFCVPSCASILLGSTTMPDIAIVSSLTSVVSNTKETLLVVKPPESHQISCEQLDFNVEIGCAGVLYVPQFPVTIPRSQATLDTGDLVNPDVVLVLQTDGIIAVHYIDCPEATVAFPFRKAFSLADLVAAKDRFCTKSTLNVGVQSHVLSDETGGSSAVKTVSRDESVAFPAWSEATEDPLMISFDPGDVERDWKNLSSHNQTPSSDKQSDADLTVVPEPLHRVDNVIAEQRKTRSPASSVVDSRTNAPSESSIEDVLAQSQLDKRSVVDQKQQIMEPTALESQFGCEDASFALGLIEDITGDAKKRRCQDAATAEIEEVMAEGLRVFEEEVEKLEKGCSLGVAAMSQRPVSYLADEFASFERQVEAASEQLKTINEECIPAMELAFDNLGPIVGSMGHLRSVFTRWLCNVESLSDFNASTLAASELPRMCRESCSLERQYYSQAQSLLQRTSLAEHTALQIDSATAAAFSEVGAASIIDDADHRETLALLKRSCRLLCSALATLDLLSARAQNLLNHATAAASSSTARRSRVVSQLDRGRSGRRYALDYDALNAQSVSSAANVKKTDVSSPDSVHQTTASRSESPTRHAMQPTSDQYASSGEAVMGSSRSPDAARSVKDTETLLGPLLSQDMFQLVDTLHDILRSLRFRIKEFAYERRTLTHLRVSEKAFKERIAHSQNISSEAKVPVLDRQKFKSSIRSLASEDRACERLNARLLFSFIKRELQFSERFLSQLSSQKHNLDNVQALRTDQRTTHSAVEGPRACYLACLKTEIATLRRHQRIETVEDLHSRSLHSFVRKLALETPERTSVRPSLTSPQHPLCSPLTREVSEHTSTTHSLMIPLSPLSATTRVEDHHEPESPGKRVPVFTPSDTVCDASAVPKFPSLDPSQAQSADPATNVTSCTANSVKGEEQGAITSEGAVPGEIRQEEQDVMTEKGSATTTMCQEEPTSVRGFENLVEATKTALTLDGEPTNVQHQTSAGTDVLNDAAETNVALLNASPSPSSRSFPSTENPALDSSIEVTQPTMPYAYLTDVVPQETGGAPNTAELQATVPEQNVSETQSAPPGLFKDGDQRSDLFSDTLGTSAFERKQYTFGFEPCVADSSNATTDVDRTQKSWGLGFAGFAPSNEVSLAERARQLTAGPSSFGTDAATSPAPALSSGAVSTFSDVQNTSTGFSFGTNVAPSTSAFPLFPSTPSLGGSQSFGASFPSLNSAPAGTSGPFGSISSGFGMPVTAAGSSGTALPSFGSFSSSSNPLFSGPAQTTNPGSFRIPDTMN